jgi:hypothetical protein
VNLSIVFSFARKPSLSSTLCSWDLIKPPSYQTHFTLKWPVLPGNVLHLSIKSREQGWAPMSRWTSNIWLKGWQSEPSLSCPSKKSEQYISDLE